MNKEEYFKKSEEKKLPNRCPILNYCGRRFNTLDLFSDISKYTPHLSRVESLQKEGVIPLDYLEKEIQFQGEAPSIIKGDNIDYVIFNNMCPEVSLFDRMNSFRFSNDKAYTTCDYDPERRTEITNVEFKHYSDCQEFSTHHFNLQNKPKQRVAQNKKRKTISKTIRFAILQRDKFTCKYCGNKATENIKLHVDHVIPVSKGGTDDLNNLVTSCSECNIGKSDKII